MDKGRFNLMRRLEDLMGGDPAISARTRALLADLRDEWSDHDRQIKVGDTIHFLASSSHNAELMKEITPAGVAPQSGGMNKEFVLKVTAPGLYGVKCRPHHSMGMVPLVQVGARPANLAAARAAVLPWLAAKRMAPMIAAVR